MPKLSDTNTTVSGAVTRKVAPNTSAKIATEAADWSTISQREHDDAGGEGEPRSATAGPERSLKAPAASTPTRAGEAHQREQVAGEKHVDAAILREGDDVGGDEEIVEAADRVDREQQPELARAGGLADADAIARPRGYAPCVGVVFGIDGDQQRHQHQMRGAEQQVDRAPARPQPAPPPAWRSSPAGRRSCRAIDDAHWRGRRAPGRRASPSRRPGSSRPRRCRARRPRRRARARARAR